jgi:hypothetical protein
MNTEQTAQQLRLAADIIETMNTITLKDTDGGECRFTQNEDGQVRVKSMTLDGVEYSDIATPVEAMLFQRLLELSWIPIIERLPTREDANDFADVEWSDGKQVWEGTFNELHDTATHWKRIVLP